MTHTRAAAPGEAGSAAGCITTTFIPEGGIADADYDTYYDAQGFPLPGNLLVGISDNGASVVVDIDL